MILHRIVGAAFVITGTLCGLSAALIALSRILTWLKEGFWKPAPIAPFWHGVFGQTTETEWIGINKILSWLMEFPADLFLSLLGAALLAWGIGVLNDE